MFQVDAFQHLRIDAESVADIAFRHACKAFQLGVLIEFVFQPQTLGGEIESERTHFVAAVNDAAAELVVEVTHGDVQLIDLLGCLPVTDAIGGISILRIQEGGIVEHIIAHRKAIAFDFVIQV